MNYLDHFSCKNLEQPQNLICDLKDCKRKPFQVFFDLLLWIFLRHPAESQVPPLTSKNITLLMYDTEIINPDETLIRREKKKHLQQRQRCFTTRSLHVLQKVRLILHRMTRSYCSWNTVIKSRINDSIG